MESSVRRILSLLLTNEVASGLNWAGKKLKEEKKQKRAFRDTKLCKCIYGKSLLLPFCLCQVVTLVLEMPLTLLSSVVG